MTDPISAYVANQSHDAIAVSDGKHVHVSASRGSYVESVGVMVTGKTGKTAISFLLSQEEAKTLAAMLTAAAKFARSKAVE